MDESLLSEGRPVSKMDRPFFPVRFVNWFHLSTVQPALFVK